MRERIQIADSASIWQIIERLPANHRAREEFGDILKENTTLYAALFKIAKSNSHEVSQAWKCREIACAAIGMPEHENDNG